MTLFATDSARPLGHGLQSPAGSVQDSELFALFRGYKRAVASRYRALVKDDLAGSLGAGPLHVSPKIDGELWFLVLDGDAPFLAAPSGRVISGAVPVLAEATAALARAQPRTVIAGELFAAKSSGRPRVGDLAAAMGGEAGASVERLGFAGFDVLQGGAKGGASQLPSWPDRLAALREVLGDGKRARPIACEVVGSGAEATALFEKWVEGGNGEGLVVRGPDEIIYKAKPTISIDAAVIGYTDSSEGTDRVGSMLLALVRDDGQFQIIGSVGNIATETRFELMPKLSAMQVPSAFRHANNRGALYRFVRPELVVEIKVTDIQSEDSAGDPIGRMVLQWSGDAASNGWTTLRELPGASILHPVFVRQRPDKRPDATDVRFTQVEERCIVTGGATRAEPVVMPASEILRREVYTKTTKGEVAVRKLVMWRTNKHQLPDVRYGAFVVCFTDYSAGRKDPLQREVRLAPTESVANKIADELVAEGVKKGWSRVE